jgi:hypothetical protein
MTERLLPSPSAVRAATELANRRLTPDELRAYLEAPVSEAEREEAVRLIRWFKKRYPTPAERLAYARRSYRRWTSDRRRSMAG